MAGVGTLKQERAGNADAGIDRRQQFVDAATHLFSRHGYHETTVKEVAQYAGVSPGLIYNYVKDKEELLLLALVGVLDRYKEELPKAVAKHSDPIDRFAAALEAYCRVVAAMPEATLLAYRYTALLPPAMRDRIKGMEIETNEIISDCIRECIAAGYFRTVNVEFVTYRVVMVAHGWALKAWRLAKMLTIDEYINGSIDLFLTALLTPKGLRRYRAQSRKGEGA